MTFYGKDHENPETPDPWAERIDDEPRATWQPLDLAPYLRGDAPQVEPTVGLARVDGLRLLYPGLEHTVIGEMESGKSWFAAACAAAELTQWHRVVYCRFEEADPTGTLERLRALGIPDDTILGWFAFVAPLERVDTASLAALLDPPPTLVIFDGINEAMSLHGQPIRDEDGAASFRRRLVKPCTSVGAATLGCDHVVKDRDRRGRDPLGSIHKGNGLTGSLILLENVAPFGRGERGCSHVYVTKDRPGHLRGRGRPDRGMPGKTYMGSLVVDDTRAFVSYLDVAFLEPPERAEAEPPGTRAEQDEALVLAAVADLEGMGQPPNLRTIRARTIGIGRERIDDALTRLVLDNRLTERVGPRSARIFGTTTVAGSSPNGGGP